MTASITCPRCASTSYNPEDVRQGYCGHCHDWTGRPRHLPELEPGRFAGGRITIVADDDLAGTEPPC